MKARDRRGANARFQCTLPRDAAPLPVGSPCKEKATMRRNVIRYSATVVPVPRDGGSWCVRVLLRNELGTIVRQALLDSSRFPTRRDADALGWRLVDAWIQRFGRTAHAS
jgi:hypothetical protein